MSNNTLLGDAALECLWRRYWFYSSSHHAGRISKDGNIDRATTFIEMYRKMLTDGRRATGGITRILAVTLASMALGGVAGYIATLGMPQGALVGFALAFVPQVARALMTPASTRTQRAIAWAAIRDPRWDRAIRIIHALDTYMHLVRRREDEQRLIASGVAPADPERAARWKTILTPAHAIITQAVAQHLAEAEVRERQAEDGVRIEAPSTRALQIAVQDLAETPVALPEVPPLLQSSDALEREEALREVIHELERERQTA